jgi:hypothetical protein
LNIVALYFKNQLALGKNAQVNKCAKDTDDETANT